MSLCHILITKEDAVDLLGVVDHAAATLQEAEPPTLLALDLLEVSTPSSARCSATCRRGTHE